MLLLLFFLLVSLLLFPSVISGFLFLAAFSSSFVFCFGDFWGGVGGGGGRGGGGGWGFCGGGCVGGFCCSISAAPVRDYVPESCSDSGSSVISWALLCFLFLLRLSFLFQPAIVLPYSLVDVVSIVFFCSLAFWFTLAAPFFFFALRSLALFLSSLRFALLFSATSLLPPFLSPVCLSFCVFFFRTGCKLSLQY